MNTEAFLVAAMSIYTHGRVRDSTMANRYGFQRAIQDLIPEVLADLERDVFPLFKALFRKEPSGQPGESCTVIWSEHGTSVGNLWIAWPSMKDTDAGSWRGPSYALDVIGAPPDPRRLALGDAMEKWASKYHL
jgi:hypothetical protein